MRDFTQYKQAIEKEISAFDTQIPNSRNSAQGMSEKITKFLEVFPKVEQHFDSFCKNYFKDEKLSNEEAQELKRLNTEIYQSFIDRAQIPTISRKQD